MTSHEEMIEYLKIYNDIIEKLNLKGATHNFYGKYFYRLSFIVRLNVCLFDIQNGNDRLSFTPKIVKILQAQISVNFKTD